MLLFAVVGGPLCVCGILLACALMELFWLLRAENAATGNVEPAHAIEDKVARIVVWWPRCDNDEATNENETAAVKRGERDIVTVCHADDTSTNKSTSSSPPPPPPPPQQPHSFDVCIMGAGAAGLMQARHMQLECPSLRICLVDPLSVDRTESDDVCHKIGESTVFTSATFLVRDLDLGDYLIAHHYPKHGLFYHWPKDVRRTESLDDYHSAASLALPEVPSFQIDRPKFERDLLQMVLRASASNTHGGSVTYVQGKVKTIVFANDKEHTPTGNSANADDTMPRAHDVDVLLLATQDAKPTTAFVHSAHRATSSTHENVSSSSSASSPTSAKSSMSPPQYYKIRATHLIDAAGRSFLIGKQKKLIVKDPAQLMNLENAAVWLQVNDLDANMLVGDAARGQTLASWLFATNHFCGNGHWLWVIPVKTRDEKFSLSIGISLHKQTHQFSQFNSPEKFMSFLLANHTLLHRVIQSGTIGIFRAFHRLPHLSRQMYDGPGQWYVLGESAYNADPWYSTGLAWCSFQIQHITAIVRAKHAIAAAVARYDPRCESFGECESSTQALRALAQEANDLASAYNEQAFALAKGYFLAVSDHWKHLGNASIMSWRVLLETCAGPGGMAGYFSKRYLDPVACRAAPAATETRIWLFRGIYALFDELLERGTNVGFQDYNEPGRVPLFLLPGYSRHSVPLDFMALDDNLRGGKYTYRSCNVAKTDAVCNWYLMCALATLVARGFGWRGFVRADVYARLGFLLCNSVRAFKASLVHSWKHRKQITNMRFHTRELEFANYNMAQGHVAWD